MQGTFAARGHPPSLPPFEPTQTTIISPSIWFWLSSGPCAPAVLDAASCTLLTILLPVCPCLAMRHHRHYRCCSSETQALGNPACSFVSAMMLGRLPSSRPSASTSRSERSNWRGNASSCRSYVPCHQRSHTFPPPERKLTRLCRFSIPCRLAPLLLMRSTTIPCYDHSGTQQVRNDSGRLPQLTIEVRWESFSFTT